MELIRIKEILNQIISSVKSDKIWLHVKKNELLYKEILELTLFLKEDAKISERVFCIINDIKNVEGLPICKECWKREWIDFLTITDGYKKYCSPTCRKLWVSKSCKKAQENKTQDEKNKMVEKLKQTVKNKYGVDNVSKLESVKKKRELTNFEKWWDTNYLKSEIWKNIEKEKQFNKYWWIYRIQTESVKKKRALTISTIKKIDKVKPVKDKTDKIKDMGYLTEGKLEEFLEKSFPWFELIRDKILILQPEWENKSRKRPDFQLMNYEKKLFYIVEFEGEQHYCDLEAQLRDLKRKEDYKNYTNIISIPYYIQLDSEMISLLFSNLEGFINFFPEGFNKFPHWFITDSIRIPLDFNQIWLDLFSKEINWIFKSKKKEILESFINHKKTKNFISLNKESSKYIKQILNLI